MSFDELFDEAEEILLSYGIDMDYEFHEWWGFYSYAHVPKSDGVVHIHIGRTHLWNRLWEPQNALEVVLHELGHGWIWQYWDSLTKTERRRWTTLFGDYEEENDYWCSDDVFDPEIHLSRHASPGPHDDWAEVFSVAFFKGGKYPKKVREKVSFAWKLINKYAA